VEVVIVAVAAVAAVCPLVQLCSCIYWSDNFSIFLNPFTIIRHVSSHRLSQVTASFTRPRVLSLEKKNPFDVIKSRSNTYVADTELDLN